MNGIERAVYIYYVAHIDYILYRRPKVQGGKSLLQVSTATTAAGGP
jgi:hypothetical protein